MRNLILTIALGLLMTLGVNAQNAKGDWYVGAGDIANVSWTEWSINPTVGYAVTDNIVIGGTVAQADSTVDMDINFTVRYFWNGYFGYVSAPNMDTDRLMVGLGKMFTFHKGVYVDPKVVYDTNTKTTNLMLGVGLKF